MIDRRNTHTHTHTPIAVLYYYVCCFIETILFRRTLRCSRTTIRRATVIAINKRFYRAYNYASEWLRLRNPDDRCTWRRRII